MGSEIWGKKNGDVVLGSDPTPRQEGKAVNLGLKIITLLPQALVIFCSSPERFWTR